MGKEKLWNDIINGNIDEQSKIIRIFLSSTFSDTSEERDYLIQYAFPELREYCKIKCLDFQIMDMRFGIRDEIALAEMSTDICLNEIENCKKVSLGPYFVGFLSRRYGYVDRPARIPKEEFELIKETLLNNKCDLKYEIEGKVVSNILEFCYLLDKNDTDQVYTLQSPNKIIENFDKESNRKTWNDILENMKKLFKQAIDLYTNQNPNGERIESSRYFSSVTEKEIKTGILNQPSNIIADNCILFIREILGLNEEVERLRLQKDNEPQFEKKLEYLKQFVELDEQMFIDNEKETRLDKLKCFCKEKMTEKNVHMLQVQWNRETGISRANKDQKVYFNELKEVFVKEIKRLIDHNISKHQSFNEFNESERKLIDEILLHVNLSKSLSNCFMDRDDNCYNEIIDYIESNNEKYNPKLPCIINGESGSGKTYLLAKLFQQLNSKSDQYHVVIRFLSLSSCSNTMETLLDTINNQLTKSLDINKAYQSLTNIDELEIEFERLTREFCEIHKNKKLVFILDSVQKFKIFNERTFHFKNLNNIRTVLSFSNAAIEHFKDDFFIFKKLEAKYNVDFDYSKLEYMNMKSWIESEVKTKISDLQLDHEPVAREHQGIFPSSKAISFMDGDKATKSKFKQVDYNKLKYLSYSEWQKSELFPQAKLFKVIGLDDSAMEKKLCYYANYPSNFLRIGPIKYETAKEIILRLLNVSKRTITDEQLKQLDFILKCNRTVYFLHIKLLYEIVAKWKSYESVEIDLKYFQDCENMLNCVEYLFKLIENLFGSILIQRLMFYQSAFKSGITENELEDILSIDDDVLENLFEYHAPQIFENNTVIRRFPIAIWCRIKYYIENYMTVQKIDNTLVYDWSFFPFKNFVMKRYFNDIDHKVKAELVTNIVDMFMETYRTSPKEFKYNKILLEKLHLNDEYFDGLRLTSIQSIKFSDNLYNERKLSELIKLLLYLRPDQSFTILSKHIAFNYDFITGLLFLKDPSIFEDLSSLIAQTSRVFFSNYINAALFISDNDVLTWRQIKTLAIAYRLSYQNITRYSESFILNLVSKLLFWYGKLKEFTEFIDKCNQSIDKCALIVPYHMTNHTYLIDSYENHLKPIVYVVRGANKYFFTCSDRIFFYNTHNNHFDHNNSSSNFIRLPENIEQYKEFRFYTECAAEDNLQLKYIQKGGVIAFSDHTIVSIGIEGNLFMKLDTRSSSVKVENIFQIGMNHILVQYELTEYFDIYNIFTGEQVCRKTFEKIIKFILCNTWNDFMKNYWLLPSTQKYIVVILEDTTIVVYEFPVYYAKTRGFNDIYLDEVDNLQFFVGNQITSCRLDQREDYISYVVTQDEGIIQGLSGALFSIILTINSGGFIIIDYESKFNFTREIRPIFCHHPRDDTCLDFRNNRVFSWKDIRTVEIVGNIEELKVIDFDRYNQNISLFIDKNKSIYLYFFAGKVMLKVPGEFDNARFVEKYNAIVACRNEIIFIYRILSINLSENKYKIVKILELEEHHDQIIYMSVAKDYIFTSSKDGAFKVFYLEFLLGKYYWPKFHKTSFGISSLLKCNERYVLSISDTLNEYAIWDIHTGKVVNKNLKNLFVEQEFVPERIFISTHTLLVFGKTQGVATIKCFRFTINEEDPNAIKVTNEHTFMLTNSLKCEIIGIQKENVFLIFNEIFGKESKFEVIIVQFDVKNAIWSQHKLENIHIYFNKSNNETFQCFADNVHLTSQNSYIFIFYNGQILYFDYQNNNVKLKSLLQDDNKKTWMNNFKKLVGITNSDDIIALNDDDNLIYIALKSNIMRIYICEKKVTNVKLKNDVICTYNSKSLEIILYTINSNNNNENIFQNSLKIQHKHKIINNFSLSANGQYVALIGDYKILSLYRVQDAERIAYIFLYGSTVDLIVTERFVVIAMTDRRVISYLIVDPLYPVHKKLIQELPSRKRENQAYYENDTEFEQKDVNSFMILTLPYMKSTYESYVVDEQNNKALSQEELLAKRASIELAKRQNYLPILESSNFFAFISEKEKLAVEEYDLIHTTEVAYSDILSSFVVIDGTIYAKVET